MRRLIVIVPGIMGGARPWRVLLDRMKGDPAFAGDTFFVWEHGKYWWSWCSASDLALELRAEIGQAFGDGQSFDEVILAGHSLGGLLVRRAYLDALGIRDFPPQQEPWSHHVRRILLFASINRGVSGDAEDDRPRRLAVKFVAWLHRMIPFFDRMLGAELYRGSVFLAGLRLDWMRWFSPDGGDLTPFVVQILGSKDALVTREDSVDIEQFPSARHLNIAGATHGDVVRLERAKDQEGRYRVIRSAFLDASPEDAEDRRISGRDKFIFVLHGIRASNRDWVRQFREMVRQEDPAMTVVTPTYGFFSAAKFFVPAMRRKHIRWLRDTYTDLVARNPDATFQFVGHSYGTYLLGECLKALPGMAFERVALVGSVLPAEFDWGPRFRRQQVTHLRNVRSNQDFPVSYLCRGLRRLGMSDIGTAGYDGFQCDIPRSTEEVFWYDGGHSAPLEPDQIPTLVHYALGKETDLRGRVTPAERRLFTAGARFAALLIALGIAAGIGLAGLWVWYGGYGTVWERSALIALGTLAAYVIIDLV